MGKVICVFRILPKNPGMFDQVKKALEKLEPNRIEEEPIAFGLKAIKFTKIIPDVGGAQDKLENQIRSTEGVDNIETLKISRCL